MDAEGRAMQEQLAEKFIQRSNRAKRQLIEMPYIIGSIFSVSPSKEIIAG